MSNPLGIQNAHEALVTALFSSFIAPTEADAAMVLNMGEEFIRDHRIPADEVEVCKKEAEAQWHHVTLVELLGRAASAKVVSTTARQMAEELIEEHGISPEEALACEREVTERIRNGG